MTSLQRISKVLRHDHKEGESDGQGKAQQGNRSGQATQEEQRQKEEAIASTVAGLKSLWNPHTERGGLILGDGHQFSIRNVHEDPTHHFKFNLDDLQRCIDLHPRVEIIGIWHSHPNNCVFPSADDVLGWPKAAQCRYWIVTEHSAYEWEIKDGKPSRVS